MSLYNITAPTFTPIVAARKTEIPEDFVPVETAMPSHVLDNRRGITCYIADGAQNTWFITNPNWTKDPTIGPDEVFTEMESTLLFGKDFIVKPGSTPIRFAGYKLWSRWQNTKRGTITPKYAIWHKQDTLATDPSQKHPYATLNLKGPIKIDDPRLRVAHTHSYSSTVTVNIDQTAKFTEKELIDLGFYPKPGKSAPCTIEATVGIATGGEIIPDKILSHVEAKWYNQEKKKYATDQQSILKLPPKILSQLGYPTEVCDKFIACSWRNQSDISIPINELAGSDLHIKEGTVMGEWLNFDKANITNWPILAVKGKSEGRTCYLCQNTFDDSTFVNVNGKNNPDSILWIMPAQTRNILPLQQGTDRKKLQKFLTTSVSNPSKYNLQAPNQADPNSVSGYVEAYNMLEAGDGIYLPTYSNTSEFIRKLAGTNLNPRQQFGVYTKAEIEALLSQPTTFEELQPPALLAILFSKDTTATTRAKVTDLLKAKSQSNLLTFLGLQ